jgi:hypothetical protein
MRAESASLLAESALLERIKRRTVSLGLMVVIFRKKNEKLVLMMSLIIGRTVDRDRMKSFDVDLKTPKVKIPAKRLAL